MAVNSNLNGSLTTVYDGLVLLEEKIASASATLSFTSSITSQYDEYLVEFIDLVNASNAVSLKMRMSTNGGSSYDSTGIYGWAAFTYRAGASGSQGVEGTDTAIQLSYATADTTANKAWNGWIKVFNPASSIHKNVIGQMGSYSGGFRNTDTLRGTYESTTAVNAFQFYFSSGNITSGTIRVYGISKTVGATLATGDTNMNVYGRLTTESLVPVSTSDRTSQGTIYFTPYKGASIPLFNGTRWVRRSFSEVSLALTATSGKNYDVFVYDNSGTVALELSAAWASDTSRTDSLALQNGVYVKSGTPTRLWLGTIRASGANVTEDSLAKRFVWNRYNQVHRAMKVIESADSWTYTLSTWRQANANAANQLAYVCGDVGAYSEANIQSLNSSSGTTSRMVSVGVDSITLPGGIQTYIGTSGNSTGSSLYKGTPGLGYHFLAWLEMSGAVGTTTWYGDAGEAISTTSGTQSGMFGAIWN